MTEQIKDGGPVYPQSIRVPENGMDANGYGTCRTVTLAKGGMSLRDYFAAAALTGLLAGQYSNGAQANLSEVPDEAFKIAEAMLHRREQ